MTDEHLIRLHIEFDASRTVPGATIAVDDWFIEKIEIADRQEDDDLRLHLFCFKDIRAPGDYDPDLEGQLAAHEQGAVSMPGWHVADVSHRYEIIDPDQPVVKYEGNGLFSVRASAEILVVQDREGRSHFEPPQFDEVAILSCDVLEDEENWRSFKAKMTVERHSIEESPEAADAELLGRLTLLGSLRTPCSRIDIESMWASSEDLKEPAAPKAQPRMTR